MSPAPPRSTRTPAAQIRQALIAAGRRILEEQGPAGLTVRAVASSAGVAPMGVYNHFEGKNGLLDAVVSDGFHEFGAAIAATDSDPLLRLTNSGLAYRRFALANPTLYSLMFDKNCHPDDDAAGTAFNVLAEIVRYCQTGGLIRDGDPNSIATEIWSCVHGAISLELAGSLPPLVDTEANYANVIDLIERGLAP